MSVSEAKRAANTANGRKGGPKTPEGKARSRMNGLKHGLRAEVAVLPGENEAAFDHRLQSWSRELQPQTEVERYLVETAVSASWRRDRCLRAETAILTERVLDAEDPDEEVAIAEAERIGAGLLDNPAGVSRRLRKTPAGCRWMLRKWDDLFESLELLGYWDLAEKDTALSLIGFRANQAFDEAVVGHLIIAFASALGDPKVDACAIRSAVGGQPRKGMTVNTFERNIKATVNVLLDRDEGRAALEAFAEEWRAELEDRLARLESIEARRQTTAADRAAFDDSASGKARLRYESMHERSFRSALRDLRAEQTARLERGGDPGPPEDEPDAPTEPTVEAPTEFEPSGARVRAERDPGIEAEAPGDRSALSQPPDEPINEAPTEPTVEAPTEPKPALTTPEPSAPTEPTGARSFNRNAFPAISSNEQPMSVPPRRPQSSERESGSGRG